MKDHPILLDLHNDSDQPKHERLKNHFIAEMLAGRLKPGQAIPTEQHLVESLGVARTTVRQAMAALENDGLIRRTRGKGTFVEADVRRKLQRGQDIFALVVPETLAGFYPSLLHGFESAASGLRHQTIVCKTDNDVTRQGDIVLQLLDKEVGGVALVPTSQSPTPAYQVRQLQKHGIPVVFCHRRVEGIAAPLLAIPFYDVGRFGGKVLAERGHRRVVYFTTHRSSATDAFLAGLRGELAASGRGVEVESVYRGDTINLQEEAVWKGLQELFAKPNRPTAIFASFDSIAEMIYLLLPRLGLRVPDDVSLLGFGGAWREGALVRRLTSVVIDEIDTGQKAVALLNEMRRGERPLDDNEEIVMELGLSDGETLGSPAAKA
jgi:GntR family transcriptional regulator of arabinose operon